MSKKRILIDETLYGRIDEYCKANGLTITGKCEQWLKSGLTKELYGDIPFGKFVSDGEPEKPSEPKPIEEEKINEPEVVAVETETIEPEPKKRPNKRRL
jgi:hypothetical protein